MTWFLVQSALSLVLAALIGAAAGWWLGRVRPRSSTADAPAAESLQELHEQLTQCRSHADRMVDDMAMLRNDLATRYAEIVRLADERDDARAAQSRYQVDLANRTAELILREEAFERYRSAVLDRFGEEPAVPPPPATDPVPGDDPYDIPGQPVEKEQHHVG